MGHFIRNDAWITTIIGGKFDGKPRRERKTEAVVDETN